MLLMFGLEGVFHHTNVAMAAMHSSTQMPAALMMIRFHLLGSVQASDTLQYKHGEKTRNNNPISWTSPPNDLQLSPCPNSWMILTRPRATQSIITFLNVKNSW